jgi:hypothetical protein
MGLSTKAAGKVMLDRVREFRHGLMEPDMKESGMIIKPTAKASLSMLMETFTKANG